jgi:hypothetical protein
LPRRYNPALRSLSWFGRKIATALAASRERLMSGISSGQGRLTSKVRPAARQSRDFQA